MQVKAYVCVAVLSHAHAHTHTHVYMHFDIKLNLFYGTVQKSQVIYIQEQYLSKASVHWSYCRLGSRLVLEDFF